ncbi:MAG: M23 family metallopeptidase [Chitinophagaceae bacterium]
MKRLIVVTAALVFLYSCKTGTTLFGKKNYHEQYGKRIADAGLAETAMGRIWFQQAEQALTQPQAVKLPYRQKGYFADDKPRATGLSFAAQRGEKLFFKLEKNPANGFVIYADLWKSGEGRPPSLLISADTLQAEFTYEVSESGNLLIRLQPELLSSGEYTLSISVGPSLGFPVAGSSGRIGSFWGVSRDGGARKHEGIDIFASKGTPVVASADGVVTRVNENNLGGKVVWMRPKDQNLNLYYAHLDQQLVTSGTTVKKGDTLGLMGNTGNAVTTSPHLHFGIYTMGGAVDPLPFVNPAIKSPPSVNIPSARLNNFQRLNSEVRINQILLPRQTIIYTNAADAQNFIAETPLGQPLIVPISSTQSIDNQLNTKKIIVEIPLLEKPITGAAAKAILPAGTTVSVLGIFNNHAFVRIAEEEGWVPASAVR